MNMSNHIIALRNVGTGSPSSDCLHLPVVVVLPLPRKSLFPVSLVRDICQQVGQHLKYESNIKFWALFAFWSILKIFKFNFNYGDYLLFGSDQVVCLPFPHPAPAVGVEVDVVEGETLLAWFTHLIGEFGCVFV